MKNNYGGIIIEDITETDIVEAQTNPWKFRSASVRKDDPNYERLRLILTTFVGSLRECPCHMCEYHEGFPIPEMKPSVFDDAPHDFKGRTFWVLHYCCECCTNE